MTVGRLKIANKALRRVHQSGLGSLDENTKSAMLVRDAIDDAIETVLRQNPSGAATTTDCLNCIPADECSTPPDFCYAYALPCEYVRINEIWSEAGQCSCKGCKAGTTVEYRVQAVKRKKCGTPIPAIVSKCEGPLKVEYSYAVKDLSLLPADLRELMALELALAIVTPLTSDASLRDQIKAEIREAKDEHSESDAVEDHTERRLLGDGALVDARRSCW